MSSLKGKPKTRFIPRLISVFTKRNTSKTPLESLRKAKIDSYLISLGILSEHYGIQSSLAKAFWKRSHQIVILWLQWFMVFKWFFCSFFIENGYATAAQVGDFTAFLKGQAFDYHFILVMWSLGGATTCHLMSLARNHTRLNLFWLKPFELCKGTVKHQEMRLGVQDASEFWERVLVTLWLSKLLSRILFLTFAAGYLHVVMHLMPRDQLDNWSICWAVVTIVWLYYNTSIQIGVMAVFHMLCYYFIAKYRQLNEMVKEVELNPKMDLMTMHQSIETFMNDHNAFAKEMAIYNKFWQYYLVVIFSIYITIVCFFVELILFTKMNSLVHVLSLITIVAFFIFLIFIAFSAGAVSEEVTIIN